MKKQGKIIHPKSVAIYWKKTRIWDRWNVEIKETRNKNIHICQRELSVDRLKKFEKSDIRVLDLCCGTGKVTYDLLNLPNVTEVVAVDINCNALNILKSKLGNHPNISKLTVIEGDVMQKKTLADYGEFDAIICLDALHHLWNLPFALKIIYEKLSFEGLFIGNCLAKERAVDHVGAKCGKFRFYCNYLRAKVFIVFSFFKILWELSGRKGYVRIGLLKQKELVDLLEKRFTILEILSNHYHWFAVKKLNL